MALAGGRSGLAKAHYDPTQQCAPATAYDRFRQSARASGLGRQSPLTNPAREGDAGAWLSSCLSHDRAPARVSENSRRHGAAAPMPSAAGHVALARRVAGDACSLGRSGRAAFLAPPEFGSAATQRCLRIGSLGPGRFLPGAKGVSGSRCDGLASGEGILVGTPAIFHEKVRTQSRPRGIDEQTSVPQRLESSKADRRRPCFDDCTRFANADPTLWRDVLADRRDAAGRTPSRRWSSARKCRGVAGWSALRLAQASGVSVVE